MSRIVWLASGCLIFLVTPVCAQQQVTVGTPFVTSGDRFYESFNNSWSFSRPGFSASFGNPNSGVPPFGGYTPNAGLSGGYTMQSGPWAFRSNFNFSQGYSRTMTSTTPRLTLSNGAPGVFINGVQQPFVTGLIPVVNNNLSLPAPLSPLEQRLMQGPIPSRHPLAEPAVSPAEQTPQRQLSGSLIDPLPPTRGELQARQEAAAAERLATVNRYWEKGQAAEAAGKQKVARQYYEMAIRRAEGEWKDRIQRQLAALEQ